MTRIINVVVCLIAGLLHSGAQDIRGAALETQGERNPVLIVSVIDDRAGIGGRVEKIMAYTFEAGRLKDSHTILENPGRQPRFSMKGNRLHWDRYLISSFGDVADLALGKMIYHGGQGRDFTQVVAVEDNRVVVHQVNGDRFSYFDVSSGESAEIPKPVKWELPGVRSPDGKVSVGVDPNLGGDSIFLHTVEGKSRMLGSGFKVELSGLSSSFPSPPLLWLDETQILTQQGNGNIVALNLNGQVEPIVRVELDNVASTDPLGRRGTFGANPQLTKHIDGRILYVVSQMSKHRYFIPAYYHIDVASKRAERLEWFSFGQGFEAQIMPAVHPFRKIRHEGKEIGERAMPTLRAKTFEGHMAIVSHDTNQGFGIDVWSLIGESWTRIPSEFPVQVSGLDSIVGWITDDALVSAELR